ncbi:tryptophan synthase alpha chain [Rhizomicrobium palustre]|uniref:Tryptophan synthase alpha chain n=1 Tax=Rhizomicrobium palustre TaxID=189966 RepID=A0A846N4Q0_9PROT|nr:tryptophan synthase subunit alpha [Rhizomicrobium palustre]NIK90499.1 tryptophan synthase alpha chain [Rhizomicrobium palustre]
MSRLQARFAELRAENRAAFIPFITAGDRDGAMTAALLERLPEAGADVIELGVPFSDPMADGPAIQAASLRALQSGMSLAKVLELVRGFRKTNKKTPLVLMGYYNPIHKYGTARFAKDAAEAGVDGLITVDLPPEEDDVLRLPANSHGVDIVRLATPTSNDARLKTILNGAGGFLYYVSITGVTGTKSFAEDAVKTAIARLKASTDLPCAVGFGIKTPENARAVATFADAAVVGSAIVDRIAGGAGLEDVVSYCAELAHAVHTARS